MYLPLSPPLSYLPLSPPLSYLPLSPHLTISLLFLLTQSLYVIMVISDWLMDPTIRTGDWRSVLTSATVQSVTRDLIQLRQQLRADNWDSTTAREVRCRLFLGRIEFSTCPIAVYEYHCSKIW